MSPTLRSAVKQKTVTPKSNIYTHIDQLNAVTSPSISDQRNSLPRQTHIHLQLLVSMRKPLFPRPNTPKPQTRERLDRPYDDTADDHVTAFCTSSRKPCALRQQRYVEQGHSHRLTPVVRYNSVIEKKLLAQIVFDFMYLCSAVRGCVQDLQPGTSFQSRSGAGSLPLRECQCRVLARDLAGHGGARRIDTG